MVPIINVNYSSATIKHHIKHYTNNPMFLTISNGIIQIILMFPFIYIIYLIMNKIFSLSVCFLYNPKSRIFHKMFN
ncbi:hypothetical protein C799_01874 [Bacteroides thetaiotaomicron dnLKV9]|uniref:Uncharacterized protein n=1 Tax=Bacteroides thetaiotaomicron dnLKV9 TaxID=1235785 RepID=R9HF74_BACT4|nr:hypothetical protein C799_01874 [Bacteroides thetaiotaomicron dnLKV9]